MSWWEKSQFLGIVLKFLLGAKKIQSEERFQFLSLHSNKSDRLPGKKIVFPRKFFSLTLNYFCSQTKKGCGISSKVFVEILRDCTNLKVRFEISKKGKSATADLFIDFAIESVWGYCGGRNSCVPWSVKLVTCPSWEHRNRCGACKISFRDELVAEAHAKRERWTKKKKYRKLPSVVFSFLFFHFLSQLPDRIQKLSIFGCDRIEERITSKVSSETFAFERRINSRSFLRCEVDKSCAISKTIFQEEGKKKSENLKKGQPKTHFRSAAVLREREKKKKYTFFPASDFLSNSIATYSSKGSPRIARWISYPW